MSNSYTSCCLVRRLAVLAVLLFLSCTIPPRESAPRLDKSTLAQGQALLNELKNKSAAEDYEGTLQDANELITGYSGFPQMDEVYYLAASALLELDRFEEAIRYSTVIPDRYPTSAFAEEALLVSAESYFNLERYFQSADALNRILLAPADSETEARALKLLKQIVREHLGPRDLEIMLERYPSSPVVEETALDIAKKEFARGNYEKAYELLADFLYNYPNHPNSPEVRRLLKIVAKRRSAHDKETLIVDPYKIGVVLPLTGNLSWYGRQFEQGIALAIEEYNSVSEMPIGLVKADTRGDPVDAVKAVRKLVHEEGSLAILGAVFKMETYAAAIEANAWGVPFLSPVENSDELPEIGPWVFQTKVPGELEVFAMARLSTEQLLLSRFAALAPSMGEMRRLCDLFVHEVQQLGGEVTAVEYFDPGSTDFKAQLEAIRESAPEALFIPANVEELILILPQIRYYDIEVQLLGLSDWNSSKLIQLASKELQGALFPLKAYHGKNSDTYQHFLVMHHERIGGEVHPSTVAGYFGTRLFLSGMSMGLSDRIQFRAFLEEELYGDAEKRRQEAEALSIMTVHSGQVREYMLRPYGDQGQD